MTIEVLKETLAIIKKVHVSMIKNIDTDACTFECGKSIYQYDMTDKGRYVKNVKFFATVENYKNTSY